MMANVRAESDAVDLNAAIPALERWLVREAVQCDIDQFLCNKVKLDEVLSDGTSITARLFRFLLSFPLLDGEKDAEKSLKIIFEALPKLDSSLKLRGLPGLRCYLAPVLTGPILSAARGFRATQASSSSSSGVWDHAAEFLSELNATPDGLSNFVEEIASVYSISEMRPAIRAWVKSVHEGVLRSLSKLSNKERESLRNTFSKFPRNLLLFSLKSQTAASASKAAIRLLFLRPLGGQSVLEKVISDMLGSSDVKNELVTLDNVIPAPVVSSLVRFHREEYSGWRSRMSVEVDEAGFRLSEKDILSRTKQGVSDYVLLTTEGQYRLGEMDAWAAIRYIELLDKMGFCESIINLLNDEALVNATFELLLITHSKVSSKFFGKGSGMTRLAEDILSLIDHVFKETPHASTILNNPIDSQISCTHDNNDNEDWNVISVKLKHIWNRSLAVVHNVLVLDKSHLVHRTIEWAFSLYRTSCTLQLPTNDMISGLAAHHADVFCAIKQEAQRAFHREQELLGPHVWSKRSPRPSLPISEKHILPTIALCVQEMLARLPLMNELSRSSHMNMDNIPATQRYGIRHIEILRSMQEKDTWSDVSSRKYVLCGRTSAASIWVRHKGDVPESLHVPPPIVEIKVSPVDDPNTLSLGDESHEWTLIPKKLNGWSQSNLYLWVRRARSREEEDQGITGIELLQSNSDVRKVMALRQCGYRVVTRIRVGVFAETHVWVCGGVASTMVDLAVDDDSQK